MSSNEEKENLLTDATAKPEPCDAKSELVTEKEENVKHIKTPSKPVNQVSDQRQMKKFLGPMLDELEKAIAENMQQLDKLEEDLLGDSRREQLRRFESHVPAEIRERKSIESILRSLEEMIIETTDSQSETSLVDPTQKQAHEYLQNKLEETNKQKDSNVLESSPYFSNTKLGDLNHLACLSQSLTSYLITKNSKRNGEKLKSLTIKLYDSVNTWISRLFRFYESSILFHDQESDGLTRICNMLLNFKYEGYQKHGYKALNKPPIIYVSAASKYAQLEYRELITIQLGLPLSSVKIIKVSKQLDSSFDKIDLGEFLAVLESDVRDGFVPLVVVANAGSYAIGQCDDLNQLNQICYKFKLWTHLEGIYLSTLALYSVPTQIQPVSSGDSITLNLATWLGIPSLSYVTLYRNVPNSGLYIQPFNSFITTLQRCLPYWCILQAVGHDGVLQRIKYANDMATNVREKLEKHKPYLKILNFKETNQETTTTKYSFGELVVKALSFLTYVDLNNPIIVFKCDQKYIHERLFLFIEKDYNQPEKSKPYDHKEEFLKFYKDIEPFYQKDIDKKEAEKKAKLAKEQIIYPDEINEYTDTLTTWFCDLINSLHKNIEFELIEIENEGVCIRFSPFDHVNVYGTNQTDVDNFSQSLYDIISILDASIKCKSKFDKEIKAFKNLIPVNVPKWAGVGAVRYIPDYLIDKLEEIEKYQLKKLYQEKEKSSELVEEKVLEKTEELPVETAEQADKNDETKELSSILEPPNDEVIKPQDENSLEPINSDKNDEDPLMEKYIKEINDLNDQLVKKLQFQDNAFSSGEASDNMIAVKFGMVNDLEALQKLAEQVQQSGKEVEESSRFIETMSDLIRQGIEKANEDLRKENEIKLMQEGLLRQIPIVSGLFNWLAPAQPVNTIGRTFNLQSGKIASTETTYKYHIQVQETNGKGDNKPNSRKESIQSTLNSVSTNSGDNAETVTNLDSSKTPNENN